MFSILNMMGYTETASDDISNVYRKDAAFVLVQYYVSHGLVIVFQDGNYDEVISAKPDEPTVIDVYPIETAYLEPGTPLGLLGLVFSDYENGVVGQAIRYQNVDANYKSENLIKNGLSMMAKSLGTELANESIDGINWYYIIKDEIVYLVLLEDFSNNAMTVIYNENLSYRNMNGSDSWLPGDAVSDLPNSTAAPAGADVCFDENTIGCTAFVFEFTDGPMSANLTMTVALPVSDAEYHLINVILPKDEFVSGAHAELSELNGVSVAPALQLEIIDSQSDNVYMAGAVPGLFQAADVTLESVTDGTDAQYQLTAAYTWNGKTYSVALSGKAFWQTVTPETPQQTQSTDEGTGMCAMCSGSGLCHLCGGKGKTYTYNSDVGWLECSACHGKGDCPWCKGTGYGGIYAQ